MSRTVVTETQDAGETGPMPAPKRPRQAPRWVKRLSPVALPLAGGALVGLSLPPIGWWPMGVVGFAAVAWTLANRRARSRLWVGMLAGIGQFSISLAWAYQFNAGGYAILTVVEAAFVGLACWIVPPGRGRLPALAGALTLGEFARHSWPFGGLPLGGVALGQVSGPFGDTARLGGDLLVAGLTFLAGACLAAMLPETGRSQQIGRDTTWAWPAGRHARLPKGLATRLGGLIGALAIIAVSIWGALAPDGSSAASPRLLRTAIVQGGGRRGLTQLQVPASVVFDAALSETAKVPKGTQFILWPEDVVALQRPFAGSHAEAQLAAIARRYKATLIAGVTYPVGRAHFRNEVVALSPAGRLVATFEKVHRVPFGEYVPFRSFFSHLANLKDIPRDAIPGTASGMVATPAGRFGVLISFEVFFADRGRSGVSAGGDLVLVPTNTSSYTDGQAPSQEVAASRLQALEQGRYVLQAAPTGYSAAVTNSGHVIAVTRLSVPAIIEVTVPLLSGKTIYVRYGDFPVRLAAGVALAAGWGAWLAPPATRARRRKSPSRTELAQQP
jgi:apolipoprotein N-acyltransferase